jgi:hypothetical protein
MVMEVNRPNQAILFVRCDTQLREELAAAAKASLRSLNNEAIYRLRESLKHQATADQAAFTAT